MSLKLENIKILKPIARGAFGEIYECIDEAEDIKLALKIEKSTSMLQLKHEYAVYKKLAGQYTPKVYEYGKILFKGEYVNCMTMDLLGLSLEKLFAKLDRKFSLKTIFMIGKSCLNRIETIHLNHFIHRDIKPDNFVIDGKQRKIYLIDYGLSKQYRNPKTLEHIKYRNDKNLTGTARYASLNTHLGVEQARRDDLESLGFMLVYFAKGRLPWQGLKADTKVEKYALIKNVKSKTPLFELCDGLPNELYLFLLHVRSLKFEECPDYAYLESILEGGLRRRGLEDDGVYDWYSFVKEK
ncbi:casein kinase I-like protein HRR25 [Pancytospora epiphaga]|nr:casein kinase I-like protein HRR25 [Pancytospora epiphaga]